MDDDFRIKAALVGKAPAARLEDWSKFDCGNDQYIIWGTCYDDELGRFPDGKRIHTSIIVAHYEDDNIVETLNSFYVLGKPKAEPEDE